ncbi:hypothetical protein J4477_04440 [Candidatus Pacearchaeota archaeon]|nr:hypothetical protein [Candidatus Pacearchaeota archaeon]
MLERDQISQIEKIEFQTQNNYITSSLVSFRNLSAVLTGCLVGLLSVPVYVVASAVFLPVVYLNKYFSDKVNTES